MQFLSFFLEKVNILITRLLNDFHKDYKNEILFFNNFLLNIVLYF